jgi:hypothetical protein
MKFFRKLLGLDFPDPEVGQRWRSQNSGRSIRVEQVDVTDDGFVIVVVAHEQRDGDFSLGTYYAFSIWQWRVNLRQERRVLVRQWPNPPPMPPVTEPRRSRQQTESDMDEEITITKAQLAAALTAWDMEAITGKWQPHPELTSVQRGVENADLMWEKLAPVTA